MNEGVQELPDARGAVGEDLQDCIPEFGGTEFIEIQRCPMEANEHNDSTHDLDQKGTRNLQTYEEAQYGDHPDANRQVLVSLACLEQGVELAAVLAIVTEDRGGKIGDRLPGLVRIHQGHTIKGRGQILDIQTGDNIRRRYEHNTHNECQHEHVLFIR